MKWSFFSILTILCITVSSCNSKKSQEAQTEEYSENRTKMEAKAQQMLSAARESLAQSDFSKAKATIQQMRKDCYLALNAREQGILLMDSIDLAISQHELSNLDSLMRAGIDSITQDDFEEACQKIQFYKQKIQHDNKKK